MRMFRTPKFWNEADSKAARLLEPVAKLYGIISSLKINSTIPTKASIPVICVGNVVLGGAGKTSTVELVCSILKKHKRNPHILTGGYGGYIKNVMRVDPSMHSYLQVGDEALLLAASCPTWIGKNRVNSAKAATIAGADVLVMDDGFQNNSLEKDFKILVVNSYQQFGNERLFPAGPLRESVDSGIKKSDAVLIIGEKNETLEERIKQAKSVPIFYAKIKAINKPKVENKRTIGFCGLGYPDKFRKTLLECGFEIADFIAFADHHPYTITEIQKLLRAAKNSNAILTTTRKDYVKIPAVFRSEISVIDIKLVPENDLFEKKLIER